MQIQRLGTSEWKTRWALAAPGAILNSKRRKPLGSLNHSVWARLCSETDLGEIRTKARWGQCLHFKVQRHIWHISLDVSYLLLILYTWPEKAQFCSTHWPTYEEVELPSKFCDEVKRWDMKEKVHFLENKMQKKEKEKERVRIQCSIPFWRGLCPHLTKPYALTFWLHNLMSSNLSWRNNKKKKKEKKKYKKVCRSVISAL